MEDKMVKLAKKLRRNMTDAERLLWSKIRNAQLGAKFRRQQPIGKYIVDFACFEEKIIIEIDGGQHYQNEDDKKRDKWFIREGYTVLRFWNNDVLRNIRGVVGVIKKELMSSCHPPLVPPIKGGRI